MRTGVPVSCVRRLLQVFAATYLCATAAPVVDAAPEIDTAHPLKRAGAVEPASAGATSTASDGRLSAPACGERTVDGARFAVCAFDPRRVDIRIFLNAGNDEPFGSFASLGSALHERGETLVFAMNGGMYDVNRVPVGHYVEHGVERKGVNTRLGPGNFHLLPNGVFFLTSKGAGVLESRAYLAWRAAVPKTAPTAAVPTSIKPAPSPPSPVIYATQSGPMLVIDGVLHPRFQRDSPSLKRRNGVGVDARGMVYFVLADTPINFFAFASFFLDELKTPNALYLDGSISRLYAPELGRNDSGASMGPIIGVVRKTD